MAENPIPLDEVNLLSEDEFVSAFGDVAEHSPWVAAEAADARPFDSREAMIAAFQAAIAASRPEASARASARPSRPCGAGGHRRQSDRRSRREQAGAGLDRLTPAEFARFTALNNEYRSRYGIPFIFAVRGATKHDILEAFERRLRNSEDVEFATALAQVGRIVEFPARRPRVGMSSGTRALGERAQSMIDALAAISAEPDRLTRLYLTPEHKHAAHLVGDWMRRAGLAVRMDAAATMHGLLAGAAMGSRPRKRLLIGSHIDTVIDAGPL